MLVVLGDEVVTEDDGERFTWPRPRRAETTDGPWRRDPGGDRPSRPQRVVARDLTGRT